MPGRLTRLTSLDTSRTTAPPRPRSRPRGLPPALEDHAIYAATNPAEAALYGEDLLGTHRVRVAPADTPRFVATFHGVLVRDVTLGYLDYRTGVTVEATAIPPHHLVLVPATGTSRVESGGAVVDTSPVRAAVPAPGEPLRLECGPDAAHLVIRIDRDALDVHLGRLLGRRVSEPLVLDTAFDLAAPTASRWNTAIQMLHAELYDPGSLLHRGAGLGQMEEFIMSSLLYGLGSNYSPLLAGPGRPERRAVRVAKEFIDVNLARAITVDDIARAAGVSVRTVQNQFREDLHETPTEYLRNRRLERARAELADAPPDSGVTVTDVAVRWGFHHLGRFATTYRARFGESPSHTLRS